MKTKTFNLPESYLECFDTLIKLGLFNSRSQITREALKEFIDRESILNSDLKDFEKIKSAQVRRV